MGRTAWSCGLLGAAVVSQSHARIFFDRSVSAFVLEDLDSKNGTRLDGLPVEGGAPLGRRPRRDLRRGARLHLRGGAAGCRTASTRGRCSDETAPDTRMADRHATLLPDGDGYLVRDESAREGVFLHLTDGSGRAVTPGTVGRVGGKWLVFGSTADPLLLGQYDPRGRLVAQLRLREGTQILGRAAPDITLTATDMSVSRRHASISWAVTRSMCGISIAPMARSSRSTAWPV